MRKSSLVLSLMLWLVAPAAMVQAQSEAHWPQWRGPFFNGMARGDAPTVWSDTKNVKWKAQIPGRGFSTPVVWGDKIFLTTAIPNVVEQPQPAAAEGRRSSGPPVEHRFEVLCLDRKTGKILWQRTAKVATPHEGHHRAYGSFASNSPITDGRYVYAFFGSRGLYVYDFNGKLIWEKDFGVQMKMRLAFGEGAAPLLLRDQLFVVFDHEGESSFIVALDKRNGKELWRSQRDERSSWSTPLAIEHNGRTEIVVSATNKVRSYDARTGKVLWESAGLGANVIPVPVFYNGMVYVMSGYRDPKLMAIKLGKDGDLTGSDAIAWSHTRGLAYTTSPVLYDNKLYVVTDNGMVSAFNAATGEPFYSQTRLPKSYNVKASPVGANGKLYLATEDGDVVVLKMGEKFEVIGVNTLADQVFIATPVIAGGEIYLRGQNTLFCISEKK
jgi:outer membrane protein assembly factor BamB